LTVDAFPLAGKVAVVTGGSRGLGREIVLAFVAAGADVVVTSRDLESCEQVAAEVRGARRVVPHACHVGRWKDIDSLVERAYDEFGRVDVLVNNAGKSPIYPSLLELSEELFDSVLAVNLKGPIRLATLIGTRMAAESGGSIINVSSLVARRASPLALPYASAKAGLNAATIALARAFAPTVRVNAIVPGAFATDVSAHWSEDMWERSTTLPALGRVGRPGEIVGTALYLASAASSYTTGALLPVDGGVL
jgi:NAD(P)-dependent dehydrogenase (short-subunit alcohol dehydrogenase family)